MKILAMDSSATVASVALCEDGALLAEYTLNNKNTHSETLLPMVEHLLSNFSLTPADIDLFAVSSGPGSFTGIRIGAATLKGLAFATDKPCVGVSTLEALALNVVARQGLICPVMNARRSQVYTALFCSDGRSLRRLLPDMAVSIAELDTILCEYGERVCFVGDGYDITVAGIQKTEFAYTPERLRHQSAFSVAQTAYAAHLRGESVKDTEIVINYLRPSQAERELMNKNK